MLPSESKSKRLGQSRHVLMHCLGDVPRSHLHKPEAKLFGSSLTRAHSAWCAEFQFSEQMCAHAKITPA